MILRPMVVTDADRLARWALDFDLGRVAGWTTGRTLDGYRSFHREMIESPPADLIRLGAEHEGALVLQALGMRETGRGADGTFLDQPTYYRQFAITAPGSA
jgi:hypothetical protein